MMTKKQTTTERKPLTDKELEQLTADDFVQLKLTEDESSRLCEINKLRELAREERNKQAIAEQATLLRDLAQVGVSVESVWDLVNSPGPYKEAIPVLLEHLKRPYMDWTRNGIARSLAVYDSKNIWPTLVKMYQSEPSITEMSRESATKDGMAVAVAASTTENNIPVLVELVRDPSNGSSRLLLLRRLRRSKSPLAKQALEDLATDPDLEKEIASWRKRS